MRTVFVDTSFYIALAAPDDALHAAAVRFGAGYGDRLVTTEYVLLEVGNFLSRVGDRSTFVDLIDDVRADPKTVVVPAQTTLFERGLRLYRARLDKEWSLTDCISFVVMREHRLTEALTGDSHFFQVGFRVLLN